MEYTIEQFLSDFVNPSNDYEINRRIDFLASGAYEKESNYQMLVGRIKELGRINENGLVIYNADVAFLFYLPEIPIYNMRKGEYELLEREELIKIYTERYKAGTEFFKKTYSIPLSKMIPSTAIYAKTLHNHYYNIAHGVSRKPGWVAYKEIIPLPQCIQIELIKEIAYYAGVIACVEEELFNYPHLLEEFNKCKSIISVPNKESGESDLKQKLILEKSPKTFPEYLRHEKKELLAEKLREEFHTERNKAIRIVIEALKAIDPPLYIEGHKEKKPLFEAMELYFNRNIGSRQQVTGCSFNLPADKPELEAAVYKIESILKSIEETK